MENSVAQRLVTALKNSGISFVSYLPETRLSQMIPLLQKDSSFRVLPTTSESEAVSIAAGAALTGNQAAVYMEGTGVYVSAYSLFTIGERFGIPMLLLVSYVGSFNDKRNSSAFSHYTKTPQLLQALGIEYQLVSRADEIEEKVDDAIRVMNSLKLPVALLFTGEFTL